MAYTATTGPDNAGLKMISKPFENFETRYYDSIPDWVKDSQSYMGASESAGILGFGYEGQSAGTVWEQKVSPRDRDATEQMELGKDMEPGIRKAFKRKTGIDPIVEPRPCRYVSKQRPFISATPDGTIIEDGKYGVLEMKFENSLNKDPETGQYQIPHKHWIQVQHQLLVTGWSFGRLFTVIGGNRFSVGHVITRDDEFIGLLEAKLCEFWDSYVLPKVPPPLGTTYADSQLFSRLHPDDDGTLIEMDDDFQRLVDTRQALKEKIKGYQDTVDSIESRIKYALGDSAYAILPDGRAISWKTQIQKFKPQEAHERKMRKLYFHKKLPKGAPQP